MHRWVKRGSIAAGLLAGSAIAAIALQSLEFFDGSTPARGPIQAVVMMLAASSSSTAAVVSTGNPVPTSGAQSGNWATGFVGTQVTTTPTVQNAAYASGNCIGGFQTVTLARSNGGAIGLSAVTLRSVGGSVPTITVYVFDANPSASTCTDKSTFTLNSADIAKLRAPPFALTLVAPTGTSATFADQPFAPPRIMLAGGSAGSGVQTIYVALVSGSTFTPGSTTDIQIGMQAFQQ